MKEFLKNFASVLLIGGMLCGASIVWGQAKVDDRLMDYSKTSGVAGNLSSVGSDTLNNLMTLWAESFRKEYPSVNVQIEEKVPVPHLPALIEGVSQLGPMSRKMKSKEINAFEEKYGFKPTAIGVALDSLAVFVNKDNPIEVLSLEEVDAIFSRTRKGGHPDVTTWDQLGLSGDWSNRAISLYGRNSASGTYGYFKSNALFKGDYKSTVKEQPGSASVVLGVTEELGSIGYSGIGYKTSGVRALPISRKKGEEAYEPNYANVLSGKYPLARMLYVYVVKEPGKPLPKLTLEYFKFVLSKQGQEIVVKDGYLPLPEEVVKKQLALLEKKTM